MYIKWTFAAHDASLPDTASSHSTIASWNIMERDTPKVDSNHKKGKWSSKTCVCFSGMFVNSSAYPPWKSQLAPEKCCLVQRSHFPFLEHDRPIFAGVNWNWCILVFGRSFVFRSFWKIRKTQLNKILNGHWKPGGGKLSYPPWN